MKTILSLCALAICGAFTLHAADSGKPKKSGADAPKRSPEEMFKKLDSNGDGSLSKDEFAVGSRAKQDPAKSDKRFTALDKNTDGKLSAEEFKAAGAGKKAGSDK